MSVEANKKLRLVFCMPPFEFHFLVIHFYGLFTKASVSIRWEIQKTSPSSRSVEKLCSYILATNSDAYGGR